MLDIWVRYKNDHYALRQALVEALNKLEGIDN